MMFPFCHKTSIDQFYHLFKVSNNLVYHKFLNSLVYSKFREVQVLVLVYKILYDFNNLLLQHNYCKCHISKFCYHINFHAKIINQLENVDHNEYIALVSLYIYVFLNLII